MIITIASPRKGQGQTTTVINIAVALTGITEKKVLIVDLNCGYSDVNTYLTSKILPKSLDDFLINARAHNLNPNSIIDCSHRINRLLSFVAPATCYDMTDSEIDLFLEYAQKQFEFVLLDTPSGLNSQAIKWVKRADANGIVITQMKDVIAYLARKKRDIPYGNSFFIINKYQKKIKYGFREIEKELENLTPFDVGVSEFENQYVFQIPYDDDIPNHINRKTLLSCMLKESDYTRAIKRITCRLLAVKYAEFLAVGSLVRVKQKQGWLSSFKAL